MLSHKPPFSTKRHTVYSILTWWTTTATWPNRIVCPRCSRIYFAHQRGVFFLIEQPMTSVPWLKLGYTVIWQWYYLQRLPYIVFKNQLWQVLFLWRPVQKLLRWCRARPGTTVGQTSWSPHVFSSSATFCWRRVAFPMAAYGAPTLKMTVFPSKHQQIIRLKNLTVRLKNHMSYYLSKPLAFVSPFPLVGAPSKVMGHLTTDAIASPGLELEAFEVGLGKDRILCERLSAKLYVENH